MTKGRKAAVGFIVGLTLTIAAELCARALAQVQAHVRLQLFPDAASEEFFRLIPAVLVAGACLHAVAFHSRRALYLVLCCTLLSEAFWSYLGQAGFDEAIAARRWTAAALSSGLAWLASIAFVMIGIPMAFLLASWLEKRSTPKRGSSVVMRRPSRTVFAPRTTGNEVSFACPACTVTVNFGASHCHSCEERFDYSKPPRDT